MPLLDIAVLQPRSCFSNKSLAFRSETLIDSKLVSGYDKGLRLVSTFSRRNLGIKEELTKNFNLGRAEPWRGGLRIKAVATVEITNLTPKRGGVKENQNVLMMDIDSVRPNTSVSEPQSSSEDSTEVDEKEKLRRMRISKANKGNRPWNKGKKHSPETLRLIKERTRLAMQDPKVKMKLANIGHAQSKETRVKIGVGVRLGWKRRREKIRLQETCHYEWQNLIAFAAKNGLLGEEELQWDSYMILDKQLEQQWLESVEQRKLMVKPKGSKKAPKSAEQKRKIAASIAAKWADPEYRNRVYSGLAKYHGTTEGDERKLRRKASGDGQSRKRSPKKKDDESKSQIERIRSSRSKRPVYKDPLANSKLEMLKNIRAERAASINKTSEAVFRAKLLIAEAERAANALEAPAKKSPIANASLTECRALIAEATQLIKSIENDDTIPSEKEIDADIRNLEIIKHRKVNEVHSLSANGNVLSSCSNDMLITGENFHGASSNYGDCKENHNGTFINTEKISVYGEDVKKRVDLMKKWVRGRLVEVAEEN